MEYNDRRQDFRFRLDQCVSLSFARETFLDAQGINLSRGGLLFSSLSHVDTYDKIFVMIKVPQGVIKAEGLIIHVEPGDGCTLCGLKFTDMAEEYRDVLVAYCTAMDEFKKRS